MRRWRPAHIRRALLANAQSARSRRIRSAGRRGVPGESQPQRDRPRDDRIFAWTSGQHNDALRPLAIALYLGPIVDSSLMIVAATSGRGAALPRRRSLCLARLRSPKPTTSSPACSRAEAGSQIPIGGKEGWYWYVLAPLVIPALLVPALARWRAAAWWIVIWDVDHHRGRSVSRLRRDDVAGARIDPLSMGSAARAVHRVLDGIGVGPLAAWTTAIRIVHLDRVLQLRIDLATHEAE